MGSLVRSTSLLWIVLLIAACAAKNQIPSSTQIHGEQVQRVTQGEVQQKVSALDHNEAEAKQPVEVMGFSFKPREFRISREDTLTCDLLITCNREEDTNLFLCAHTYHEGRITMVIDDSGNEYQSDKVRVAGVYESDSSIEHKFIAGVPIRATLIFNRVSSDIEAVALMEIACSFGESTSLLKSSPFTVRLRDIPLTR